MTCSLQMKRKLACVPPILCMLSALQYMYMQPALPHISGAHQGAWQYNPQLQGCRSCNRQPAQLPAIQGQHGRCVKHWLPPCGLHLHSKHSSAGTSSGLACCEIKGATAARGAMPPICLHTAAQLASKYRTPCIAAYLVVLKHARLAAMRPGARMTAAMDAACGGPEARCTVLISTMTRDGGRDM